MIQSKQDQPWLFELLARIRKTWMIPFQRRNAWHLSCQIEKILRNIHFFNEDIWFLMTSVSKLQRFQQEMLQFLPSMIRLSSLHYWERTICQRIYVGEKRTFPTILITCIITFLCCIGPVGVHKIEHDVREAGMGRYKHILSLPNVRI